MKVCPCNGATSLGTIVEVSKKKVSDTHYRKNIPESVEVIWATGKKRGKRTCQSPHSLVDFTAYTTAVKAAYDKLEQLREEASTFGL